MPSDLLPRLKSSLSKTRSVLTSPISELVTGRKQLSEKEIEKLEEILYTADVGYEVTESIIERLKNTSAEEYNRSGGVRELLRELLIDQLVQDQETDDSKSEEYVPTVIMVVGVNGSGKTTTVGKLGAYFSKKGKSVILAAADTFRDAAIEQLQIWGNRLGFRVIRHKQGSDAAAVIFDAIKSAKASKTDYLIIDTAGRLHTKSNLMRELEKMQRITSREIEGAPHEIYLVLDANTGQNGLAQAEKFLTSIDISALIIAKMDGTARAGFIFGIQRKANLPVEFLGIGEKADDLVPFDPVKFVDALLS